MPRDGAGVHALDPGYLAVAGQIIQPSQHNPPLEDLSAAITDSIARTGVTAVTADIPFGGFKLTGVGDATAALDALNRQTGDARYTPRVSAKSANYTVVAADIGTLFSGTGTWTLTLLAAATAANGFSFSIKNAGTGLITIDADGAETIDGALTFLVHPRQIATFVSNGTSWELIDSNAAIPSAVAASSQTAMNWTDIPPTASQIDITLTGISTSGTSAIIIQAGDSGGIENSGYLGTISYSPGSTSPSNGNLSTSFVAVNLPIAAGVYHGVATLTLTDPTTNTWTGNGSIGASHAGIRFSVTGSKSLSAPLDRVRLTMANGTDTFDAGKASIRYTF